MDLHCTVSNASVCDAQRPAPGPDSVELSSTVAGAVEPSSLPVEPASLPVELPYSKVRAVTRVATVDTEDALLNIALHGTAAHVERTVRGFRRVQRELERNEARELHERRYLDCRREADGSVNLEACLPAELGEMLLKALDAARAELDERDQQEERDEQAQQDERGGREKRDERDERDERGECYGEAEHAGTPAGACAVDADSNAETADVSAETYGKRSAQSQRSGAAASGVSAETSLPRQERGRGQDALPWRRGAGGDQRGARAAH